MSRKSYSRASDRQLSGFMCQLASGTDGFGCLISIEALRALWQPLGADSMIPPLGKAGRVWNLENHSHEKTRLRKNLALIYKDIDH